MCRLGARETVLGHSVGCGVGSPIPFSPSPSEQPFSWQRPWQSLSPSTRSSPHTALYRAGAQSYFWLNKNSRTNAWMHEGLPAQKAIRGAKGPRAPTCYRLGVQLLPHCERRELPSTAFQTQRWFSVDSAAVWGVWMKDIIGTQSPHWGTLLNDPGSPVCSVAPLIG